MTYTHTYVKLPVSQETFDEIRNKLLDAGYGEFLSLDDESIDMHGLAIIVEASNG